MTEIETFSPSLLPQTLDLINLHIGSVVPGWGITGSSFAAALESYPQEYITDPWVTRRQTLCALQQGRVVAAAHLLAYGSGPEVSQDYHLAGEIAWLVFDYGEDTAARSLLEACQEQLSAWQVSRYWAWTTRLPVPCLNGIADVWPHIEKLFCQAGYTPGRKENLYGGWIDAIPAPGEPPLAGLTLTRRMGCGGVSFVPVIDGRELGFCECGSDLTGVGQMPNMRGWGEIADLRIQPEARSRGIGTWVVRHALEWLRLGGCDRVILSVDGEDEAAGAGRFYQRFGWEILAHQQVGWEPPTKRSLS